MVWGKIMELNEAKEILKENGYIMSGLDYDYIFNHIFGKSKKEIQKEKDERKIQITARYLAANVLFKEIKTALKEHFGREVGSDGYVWKKGNYLQEAPYIRFYKNVKKDTDFWVYISLTMIPGNFYIDYQIDEKNWFRINNVDPNEILQIIIDYYEDPESIKRYKAKPSKKEWH